MQVDPCAQTRMEIPDKDERVQGNLDEAYGSTPIMEELVPSEEIKQHPGDSNSPFT